jgi:putative copper resistance protein D
MIDFGLVVARFLHYAAVTTLFGTSFFPLCAYRNAEPIPFNDNERVAEKPKASATLLFVSPKQQSGLLDQTLCREARAKP